MSKGLTQKELLVIETFDKLRPGHGAIAKQNILNPNSGWRQIIEQMTEEEINLGGTVNGYSETK